MGWALDIGESSIQASSMVMTRANNEVDLDGK